jgi:hypothetical protein
MRVNDDELKAMMKLAILASVPVGMGFLHHDPTLTADKINDIGDYIHGTSASIDYYRGRMVKFNAWKYEDGWEFERPISSDYQSWSRRYNSYEELYNAVKEQERINVQNL